MSWFSYLQGVIGVNPYGRSTLEKEYVLKTVLNHQPHIYDMDVCVGKSKAYTMPEYEDEFGQITNLPYIKDPEGWGYEVTDLFFITVNGVFDDVWFDQIHREFVRWLTRLAKRVLVESVLVSIKDYAKSTLIQQDKCDWDRYFDLYSADWAIDHLFDKNFRRVWVPQEEGE